MGYSMIFVYVYMMCEGKIRVVSISIISNIYPFFVLGTFKVLSSSYFENCSYPFMLEH
jgi:hypothetical protein